MSLTRTELEELFPAHKVFPALVEYCRLQKLTDKEKLPKCKCGKLCTPNTENQAKGFTQYCSVPCRLKYGKRTTAHDKLENREWLYEQRVTLRKSKDLIASELGCSHILVNKWIKKHGIPSFRLQESPTTIRNKLTDKVGLEEMYTDKTMEQIAGELGTTKSTVSIWFQKHGITPKADNSWPRQFTKTSVIHQEILDYLGTIYGGTILSNDRSTLGTELDILILDKKLAIEVDGLYYHTDKFKPRGLHLEKTNRCTDGGLRLFHIFEDQWIYHRPIVESMISYALGVVTIRIPARKCVISMVSPAVRRKFFEDNHLQGDVGAKIAYGLYQDGELVACMSFRKPRFNQKYDLELIRFANKIGTTVSGGFSRLVSKVSGKSIITYADRTYSDAGVYLKCGFEQLVVNPPSYWYTDNKHRYPRTMFSKKQLSNKLGNWNLEGLSEREITEKLGLRRIWNCGTVTLVKQT